MSAKDVVMSLENVLAAHWLTLGPGVCKCGWVVPEDPMQSDLLVAVHYRHVAEEVRTWLRAALTSPEVEEAGWRALLAANNGPFSAQAYAHTVLAAVAETLGAK